MVRIDADDVLTTSWQRALLFPLARAHQRMRPNICLFFTGRCCIRSRQQVSRLQSVAEGSMYAKMEWT